MKEEKSDYDIINKITNKKVRNEINSNKELYNLLIFPKNINYKMSSRPYSNYIPKYNKNALSKPTKTNNYNLIAIGYENKIKDFNIENNMYKRGLNSSKIKIMNDKEINTKITYLYNNKASNNINLINEFNLPSTNNLDNTNNNLIEKEYLFASPIKKDKSNLNNLTDIKTVKTNNIYNKKINRYLSPKLYMSSKINKIKTNLTSGKTRCISPSTSNNSIINTNNNSFSTHFIFGNSFIANNIPKNLIISLNNTNNFNNIQNIDGNMISIKNKDNISNKKMTLIEYQLNKLLEKKENNNNINKKYKEKEKYYRNNESFNFEEFYLNYAKKIDESSLKESIVETNNNYSSNKREDKKSNIKQKKYYNKKFNSNNIKKDNKNDKNIKYNYNYSLSKNKSKKKLLNNPIIKYSFLDKMINNITRKINLIKPNSENEYELDIARDINGDILTERNYQKKDFITYGYELTPERILKTNQIKIEKFLKESLKDYKKSEIIKKIKRPISSIFLSQKKNYKIHKNGVGNKFEETKNTMKEEIKSIFKNNRKNRIYNLIDNKILTMNNTPLNYYNQTYIECLGDSTNRNKLDWNLISDFDKNEGKIFWKKLIQSPISTSNTTTKININNDFISNKKIQKDSNISRNNNRDSHSLYYLEKYNNTYFLGENTNNLIRNYSLNDNNDDENDDLDEIINKNINSNKKQILKKCVTEDLNELKDVIKINKEKEFGKTNNFGVLNDRKINEEKENKTSKKSKEKLFIKKEENKRKNKIILKNKKTEKEIIKKENVKKNLNNIPTLLKTKRKNKIINIQLIKNKKKIIIQKIGKKYYIKDKNKDLIGLRNYNKSKKKEKNNSIKKETNSSNQKNNKEDNNKNNNDFYEDILSLNSSIIEKNNKTLTANKDKIFNDLNSSNALEEEIQNLSNEDNEENVFKTFKRKLSKIEYIKRKTSPEILFNNLIKNWKFKEDKNTDKYYNDIFSKYGKESEVEMIDITMLGMNLKIKKKTQKNFYNKLMTNIRQQNKIKQEQFLMNKKISEFLNSFNKNDIKNDFKRNKKRKNKTSIIYNKNNINVQKKEEKKEFEKDIEENEYEKKYFWGIKIDSVKELEKKKEEVLLRLKNDIKYKIKEGIFNQSEMDNFLKFQKKINALTLEGNKNRVYIKQLEQYFNSFEEELKMHEEKKKNEKRINDFLDSMNFDLYRKQEMQKAIEKYFCHPIDYKYKNCINELSSVRNNGK